MQLLRKSSRIALRLSPEVCTNRALGHRLAIFNKLDSASHDDHESLLRAERQVSTLAEKVDRTVHEAKMEEKRKHVIQLVTNIFEEDFINSLTDDERRNMQYIRQDSILFQPRFTYALAYALQICLRNM